jgi:molecular chaperone GrpE
MEMDNDSIENLRKVLSEEKARADANLAGWQRAQADFANYKRRAEQERADTCKYASENMAVSILPVLDDLERAIANIPPEDADRDWVQGMKLIDRKFRNILEKQGITKMDCVGEEFDCRRMEAVTTVPGQKDIVVQELEKGYKMQDKVIRPAKVMVGKGEESQDEQNDSSL